MKLFVVTCLKESLKDVQDMFRQANIKAFSVTDVSGFQGNAHPDLLSDWLASGAADFNSSMIFSFTDASNAENGMRLIKTYNEKSSDPGFPVHAFILPVEQSSH